MGEQINSIIDVAAITKQYDAAKKMIADLAKSIEEISSKGVSMGKDTSAPKTMKDTIDAAKQLAAEQKKLADINAKIVEATTQEYAAKQKLLQQQKELQKQTQLEVQATNDNVGAYTRMKAELALAEKAYRDLYAAKGKDNEQTQKALKVASDLKSKMYEMNSAYGNYTDNVGNYSSATKELIAQMQAVTQKMGVMKAMGQNDTDEFQQMKTKSNELGAQLSGMGVSMKDVAEMSTTVKEEMRNLTRILAQMKIEGKDNTKEFFDMTARLGEVKDAFGDVKQRAAFFADDARWLRASVEAVKGLAGAWAAFQGVAQLAGIENEDLQKSMVKLQSAMSILMGLQEVSTMLNKDSMVKTAMSVIWDKAKTAALALKTKAQIAFNIAQSNGTKGTGAAINATKGATTAFAGTGKTVAGLGSSMGLVAAGAAAAVAALAGLVYGMINFNKTQLEAKKDTKEWKEQQKLLQEEIIKTRSALNGTINTIGEYILSLKKRGKSEKELIRDQIALAKIQAESLAQLYETYAKQTIAERVNLEFQKKAIEARKVYSKENEGLTLSEIQDLNHINMAIAEKKKTEADYYASARAVRLTSNKVVAETTALIKQEEAAADDREKKEKDAVKTKKESITIDKANVLGMQNISKATLDIADKYIYWSKAIAAAKRNNSSFTDEFLNDNNIILNTVPATLEAITTETDKYSKSLETVGQKWVSALSADEFTGMFTEKSAMDSLISQYEKGAVSIGEFTSQSQEMLASGAATWEETQAAMTQVLAEETARRSKIQQDGFNIANKLTQEAFSTISAYVSQSNEETTNGITAQFDTSQEAIQNLLDAGVISQEEYNQRMASLEHDRDEKLKEQKIKYAKQTRDLAAFQAIINTAAAVVVQLASGVGPEAIAAAIAVGIMGGIEVAAIYAQPLPTFAKGRESGPATDAVVGEKGFEYIRTATGDLFKTPNAATITHLGQGDKVYTHSESLELEKYLSLPKYAAITSTNNNDMQMIGKYDELINAVKNKPSAIVSIDKHGYSFMVASGNRQQRYINNHIKFKSW